MKNTLKAALFGLGVSICATLVSAQGLFSPAVEVNDSIVTNYEIDQRVKFLRFIQRLGDLEEQAIEDLIDDRLKAQAAKDMGISIASDQIREGMVNFAASANIPIEQALAMMEQAQIDVQTLEDFVRSNLLWRQVVQTRFRGRVQISDSEIDAAMGGGAQAGLQVNMSEIVIPLTPENQAQAQNVAQQISELQSKRDFADAARRFSAASTRVDGGEMGWLPLNRLPPALQPVVVGMRPGEISDPIQLGSAVAIFMMHGIGELPVQAQSFSAIEYATLRIAGGKSEAALAQAAEIKANVDTCDDLYGINKGGPDEALSVVSELPRQIPRAISLELAKLDQNEVSTALTSSDGSQLLFIMLCGRTASVNEEASRDEILLALQNRRLNSYAEGYLEQLRSEAIITRK